MNFLTDLYLSPFVYTIGWTLIHACWQITLVAIVLKLLLLSTEKFSAKRAYGFSVIALLCILGWSCSTFIQQYGFFNKELAIEAPDIDQDGFFLATTSNEENQITAIISSGSDMTYLHKVTFFIESYLPWFVGGWFVGVLLLMLRFVAGWIQIYRLKTTGLQMVDDDWLSRIEKLKKQLGISKKVDLFFSTLVKEPVTIGHFKPIILVPVSIFTQVSPEMVEAILLHELAHIKRADFLINTLQSLIEIVFFFHPAVWWMGQKIRQTREHACDDLAVAACNDPLLYANTLTQIQSVFLQSKNNLAMTLSGKNGSFTTRIKRLFGYSESSKRTENIFFSAILFISLLILGFTNPFFEKVEKNSETNKKVHEFQVRYKSEIRGLEYHDAIGAPGTGKPITISCDNCYEDLSLHILNNKILEVPKGLCFPPAISALTVVDSFFLIDEDLALKLYGKEMTAYSYYFNNKKDSEESVVDIDKILNNSFTTEFDTIIVRDVTLKTVDDKPAPLCFLNGEKMEVENLGDWPTEITSLTHFDSIMIISGQSAWTNYGKEGKYDVWHFYHTLEMFRLKKIWAGNMLYIINGEYFPPETPNLQQVVKDKIGANKVLTHCLYFGDSAVEMYGEAGINGVKSIETELPESAIAKNETAKNRSSILSESLKIYPNPVVEQNTVEFILDKPRDVEVLLFSSEGKLVKTIGAAQRAFGKNKMNWSVGDLPSGIYYLHVKAEGEEQVKPVIVEKN